MSVSTRLRRLCLELDQEEETNNRRLLTLSQSKRDLEVKVKRLEQENKELKQKAEQHETKFSELEEKYDAHVSTHATSLDDMRSEVVSLKFELAILLDKLSWYNLKCKCNKDWRPAQNQNKYKTNLTSVLDSQYEEKLLEDLILPDVFSAAATNGLDGIVQRVLYPTIDHSEDVIKFRHDRLKTILSNALLEACVSHQYQIVEMLINNGADVNVSRSMEQGGRSALHFAVVSKDENILSLLVKQDSLNKNVRDSKGYTPLHLATKLRKATIIKALLHAGVDTTIKTDDNLVARDLLNSSNSFSINQDPRIMETIQKLFDSPVTQFWNLSSFALQLYKAKRYEKAILNYDKACKLAEFVPHVISKVNLSRLFYNTAKAALKLHRFIKARQCCDEALSRDANYMNAVEVRAECHLKLYDFQRCINDYETLISNMKGKNKVDDDKLSAWLAQVDVAKKYLAATHYHVLGLKSGASSSEIKRGFRSESIRWHPDKHQHSEEDVYRANNHFHRINEARSVLTDQYKKIIYDSEVRRNSRRSSRRSYFDDDSDDFDMYNFDPYDSGEESADPNEFPWMQQTVEHIVTDQKQAQAEQAKSPTRSKSFNQSSFERQDREEPVPKRSMSFQYDSSPPVPPTSSSASRPEEVVEEDDDEDAPSVESDELENEQDYYYDELDPDEDPDGDEQFVDFDMDDTHFENIDAFLKKSGGSGSGSGYYSYAAQAAASNQDEEEDDEDEQTESDEESKPNGNPDEEILNEKWLDERLEKHRERQAALESERLLAMKRIDALRNRWQQERRYLKKAFHSDVADDEGSLDFDMDEDADFAEEPLPTVDGEFVFGASSPASANSSPTKPSASADKKKSPQLFGGLRGGFFNKSKTPKSRKSPTKSKSPSKGEPFSGPPPAAPGFDTQEAPNGVAPDSPANNVAPDSDSPAVDADPEAAPNSPAVDTDAKPQPVTIDEAEL